MQCEYEYPEDSEEPPLILWAEQTAVRHAEALAAFVKNYKSSVTVKLDDDLLDAMQEIESDKKQV